MPRITERTAKIGQRFWVGDGIWCRKTKHKGKMYGIQYTHEGRTIRETIGGERDGVTKTLAKEVLRKRRGEIVEERFELPGRHKAKAPKVSEFADTYLDHAKQHKRSWRRDAGVMDRVKAFMGAKRIDSLTTWDVERYKAARRESGITAASVNREIAILKRSLTLAVSWGVIEKNPAAAVKLFKENERPTHALSAEEQTALIEACREHLRPIVVTAVYTGMRRSELLNLRWDDINLTVRVVTVKQSKSGRVRHIPVNSAVVEALSAIERPEGYVFTFRGRRIETVRRAFLAAVKRAEIRPCRFHDLRHTFATNLVLTGVDLVTVKELMGHASIITTMRYAHPTPEAKRAAVESLVQSKNPLVLDREARLY